MNDLDDDLDDGYSNLKAKATNSIHSSLKSSGKENILIFWKHSNTFTFFLKKKDNVRSSTTEQSTMSSTDGSNSAPQKTSNR